MSSLLFVYGTLLSTLDNEYSRFLKSQSQVLGRGDFQGNLYEIDWYPGVIASSNEKDKVYGDVLRITSDVNAVLHKLDEYEGVGDQFSVPNQYTREIVDVTLNGNKVKCWVYLYNHSVKHCKQIKSGNFTLK